MAPDPLAPLMELPGVAAASDQAREALGRAHRHRANLRRWPVAAARVDESRLGRPRADADVGPRLELLTEIVTGATKAAAPVVAAVAHGELLTLAPFGTADGVVARAVSRLVTIATGLDPHGLGVPEVAWMRRAADYRDAARGFADGTPEGMTAWLVLSCRAMRTGAQEALSIAETLAEGRASGGSDE